MDQDTAEALKADQNVEVRSLCLAAVRMPWIAKGSSLLTVMPSSKM